ncbi:hypothetical protein EV421DRAFT_981150 [Armillaria borealis]|uniref:Uncharacterized protein n=1 Tax=Armillaria borealis TaxID=47425 RepID=A0AA39J8A2_9AGAR|nr:hypothetical protein EV421DRAFT_981150 [Armillaria borealis]
MTAVRRLFPGEGSVEPEPTGELEEKIQQLKRTLRIERVTQILLVIRDRRARDNRADTLRENDRLRDKLRYERRRNRRKEQDPVSKVIFGVGLLTIGMLAFCVLFGLFEAMTKIPFQTLPCRCMLYLRRVLDAMRRSWVEYGCPLLVQLSEHGSNARLTEGEDGQP